ncbi:MAG: hypothetical protein ABI572_01135 [Actinomycetota bacterium]
MRINARRRVTGDSVLAIALVMLAGCVSEPVCTAVGAPSTLTVDVAEVLAQRDVPMRVTVCVRTTCHSAPRRTGVRDGFVEVDEPTIEDEGPVEVRVILETRSGEVVYRETATVPLGRMQPNGPGCDPIRYAVALKATDQGLVPA